MRLEALRLGIMSPKELIKPCLGMLVLFGFCLNSGEAAQAATLSGTFAGVTSSSTANGVAVTGSFSIGPQDGSGIFKSGPGYLDYSPDPGSVILSFTSSYGTFTFTNNSNDATIILGDFGSGIQSIVFQINDPDVGASLTLNTSHGDLFSGSVPPYSGSSGMDGYAAYAANQMNEGFQFTSLSVDGPLSTPLPSAAPSTVPLPPSWAMMFSGLIALAGFGVWSRRIQPRLLIAN